MNRLLPTIEVDCDVSDKKNSCTGRNSIALWSSGLAMAGVLALFALPTTGNSEAIKLPNQVERQSWDRAMACNERGDKSCAKAACDEVSTGNTWIGPWCHTRTYDAGTRQFERGLDKTFEALKGGIGETHLQFYPKIVAADKLKGEARYKAIAALLDIELNASFGAGQYLEQHQESTARLAELQKRAEAGEAEGQYLLGAIYFDGGLPGVQKNDALAMQWASRAATQDHAKGQVLMALIYLNGRGVPQDRAEAAKWFRKAADQGLPRAQYLLALLLKDGKSDPPDDLPQASHLLLSAANNGYKEAQNELGVMYEQGVGTKQSYTEAIRWYQQAAAQGEPFSLTNLGRLAESGFGMPKDHAAAARWYEMALKLDVARAKGLLARLLVEGWGTSQDVPRAIDLYRQAGLAGEASSWFDLGFLYEQGKHVPQNDAKAMEYYARSADGGNRAAMYNMSTLLKKQPTLNATKILEWMKKSAELGYAPAQNDLGVAYHNGEGIDVNLAWAIYWYAKAAQQDDEIAIQNLKKVLPNRTPSIVTGANVNLRAEPSTNAKPLTTLAKGTRVYPLDDPTPGWKEVYVEQGHRLGYLSTSVLTTASTPSTAASPAASNSSPWPEVPASKPGYTTCNTNCRNGDCYRTYANGKKVRIQAKQKWNPISGQFEWDAGDC